MKNWPSKQNIWEFHRNKLCIFQLTLLYLHKQNTLKMYKDQKSPIYLVNERGEMTYLNALSAILGNIETAEKYLAYIGTDFSRVGELCPNLTAKQNEKIAAINTLAQCKRKKEDRPQFKSSKDAYEYMAGKLEFLGHEEFWVVGLNRTNRPIFSEKISMGGRSSTVVDPVIIMKKAILKESDSIMLFHNHPSGSLNPSQSDIDITKKLKQAGEFLDLSVLDHIIISSKGYYSFADEGML
jgi:DNA repair protein RadC